MTDRLGRVKVDVFELSGCCSDKTAELVVSLIGDPELVCNDLNLFIKGDDDARYKQI